MCDFLCYIGTQYKGHNLLNIIQKPYGSNAPRGKSFNFSWGSIAVLEDHLANNKNIIVKDGTVVAWVGDLVLDVSEEFITDLIKRVQGLTYNTDGNTNLQSDRVFSKLNGAFALIVADSSHVAVITDMLAFTQVYIGKNVDNNPICLGTHPDLVSVLCGAPRLDTVSIGEFISKGTTRFPHSMYENVTELDPGSLHIYEVEDQEKKVRKCNYWYPPKEIQGQYNKDKLVNELRETLIAVVRDRCNGRKVGVTLSGGLDSRLILAVVPQEIECIGLTFCDYINRETRIAKRIAQCYKRKWIPIFRKKDFLVDCFRRTVELQGCEFDFFNAHAAGISDDISELGLNSILSGMQMDVYLKAYFATDWVCKKRMKGLLSDIYEKINYDYVNNLSEFDSQIFTQEVFQQILARRQHNNSDYKDLSRGSKSEWFISYPFSQDKIGACWAAERRILPVKLVAMDRRLLEFAFSCPIELKLGGHIFMDASMDLYGEGVRIPSANDGVRPGSGHWSRLVQRAVRKLQDRFVFIIKKMGVEPKIQHSWHDYQKYWRESEKLKELRYKYGANLEQFDGVLFQGSSRALLEDSDIDWCYGFRLLQLAVWLDIIKEYRKVA